MDSLCGVLTRCAAGICSKARRVSSVPTPQAHLGRLIGVPTVALFGPGSALCPVPENFGVSPFTALTIPTFRVAISASTMKREIAWIRRCERFPGSAPGQCPQAQCMLALTEEMVWQATASRMGIATN
jgi:hypothetical protein